MTAGLERVTYCSRASTPNPESLAVLIQILAVSQRNNARDEISGALAISQGRYFQVIEGRPSSLDNLLARIEKDGRHDRIEIVECEAIDRRLFGEWAMVAPTIQPGLAAEIDKAVDECHHDPGRALQLLLDVVRKQSGSHDLIGG